MKFLCEQCKAKYQIADDKAVGRTVRMKCRKCGHLIEVRAAVTETSVSSALPRVDRPKAGAPATGLARPQPPRTKPHPAQAEAGPEVASEPERIPGALEGAFKSAVKHEGAAAALARRARPTGSEEGSAPFDMADLSASDEWYVAINGVPVGPIRVAEVRRKAALGAVTEESLVWQEGLDEWRPLRQFAELAASVREAMTRVSRPPTEPSRSSSIPPPPRPPARSVPPAGFVPRMAPPRSLPASHAYAPRSNVVPFMSRAATAEKLEPSPQEASPVPGPPQSQAKPVIPSVVPDPFASAPIAAARAGVTATPVVSVAPAAKRTPPWTQLAMIAAATAFGITAAFIWLSRPSPPAAGSLAIPSAASPSAVVPAAAIPVPTAVPTSADLPETPAATVTATPKAPPTPRAAPPAPAAAASASGTGRSLDLHSLAQSAPNISPADVGGGDTPKSTGGQSLTEGQVQQVIAAHRPAIGRVCWERNPSSKGAVNVSVILTVAPDGSAQNVSATGDEVSVAKCIENEVRNWRFPATGSSQRTSFSLKFVRQ